MFSPWPGSAPCSLVSSDQQAVSSRQGHSISICCVRIGFLEILVPPTRVFCCFEQAAPLSGPLHPRPAVSGDPRVGLGGCGVRTVVRVWAPNPRPPQILLQPQDNDIISGTTLLSSPRQHSQPQVFPSSWLFIALLFILVKYTQRKIYHFDHFKCTVWQLCRQSYHYGAIITIPSRLVKLQLFPLITSSHHSPSP